MKQANILIIDLHGQNEYGDQLADILGSLPGFAVRIQYEQIKEGLSLHDIADHIQNITCSDTSLIFLMSLSVHPERTNEIVRAMRKTCSDLPIVVVLEGWQSHDIVHLMQHGATDFLVPPLKDIDIIPRIWRLLGQVNRMNSLTYTLKEKLGLKQLVGRSPVFLEATDKIPLLAKCDSTVLISGETGTGKELYARAVHYLSPRADKAFMPVNCGAIPLDLIENELFGHESGAFTGASTSRHGLIEEADGGTLFLDEIDCLPASAQVKLLRFLQEKEFRKLGSTKIQQADVRVISATNVNLDASRREGKFRSDLFYRLNIIPVRVPALSDRKEDIPLLAQHFLERYSSELNRPVTDFEPEAMEKLVCFEWPGNVRELENVIERAVIFSRHSCIESEHIDLYQTEKVKSDDPFLESFRVAKSRAVEEFERDYIRKLLTIHKGNIAKAAKAAQKNRRAFWELIRKHGIETKDFTSLYSR